MFVAITSAGERCIACQMQIEPESLPHLRRFPGEKAAAIQTALQPLLVNPPKPAFTLRWDEEARNWRSPEGMETRPTYGFGGWIPRFLGTGLPYLLERLSM